MRLKGFWTYVTSIVLLGAAIATFWALSPTTAYACGLCECAYEQGCFSEGACHNNGGKMQHCYCSSDCYVCEWASGCPELKIPF